MIDFFLGLEDSRGRWKYLMFLLIGYGKSPVMSRKKN
jgi:hypothetical protein